jgi:hypothetical protein
MRLTLHLLQPDLHELLSSVDQASRAQFGENVEELTDSIITTLRSGSNGLPLWNETAYLIPLCFSPKTILCLQSLQPGAFADNREDDQIYVTK